MTSNDLAHITDSNCWFLIENTATLSSNCVFVQEFRDNVFFDHMGPFEALYKLFAVSFVNSVYLEILSITQICENW